MPRVRGSRWIKAFIGWTAVGIFGAAQSYLYRRSLTELRLPRFSLWQELSSVWIWALFTPPIMRVAERYPLGRPHLARRFALHGAAALLFSLLDVAGDWPLYHLFGWWRPRALVGWFTAQLFINTFSYFAIAALAHANSYLQLSETRRRRTAELEEQLTRAQLQALEMQLRPHFLFNTLHTVAGLVRTGEAQGAVRMLAGLGDLLRAVLHTDGRAEVTLAEELAFIKRYLSIEQARFGDRLAVRFDIEPAAHAARVPRLVLQPLVENAVLHGLGDRAGMVEIVARVERAALRLAVRDSGDGRAPPRDVPGRVGLANTRARLHKLYGDRHVFTLTRDPGGWTEARLVIPLAEPVTPERRRPAQPEPDADLPRGEGP